jgi:hypothetical protein
MPYKAERMFWDQMQQLLEEDLASLQKSATTDSISLSIILSNEVQGRCYENQN